MPNGAIQASDQWTIEVNGQKFGPYTAEQIFQLLRQRDITSDDKVTAAHLDGKWITVQTRSPSDSRAA